MGDEVSTSCLINLALDLSTTWIKLARALALEGEVERIKEDYRRNVSEQAYRMLLRWKQRNGSLATLQVLGEALKKSTVSRKDLAQKYCENNNPGSWETEINLEGQLKDGQVWKDDINFISEDIGKDWLWVGRVLGIEDSELDNIRESHTQLSEWSYQMLQSWAGKNGDQATYECLARALLHRAVGKRDIAEKCCFQRQHPLSASGVSHGEGIPYLGKKMQNLALGDSSANKSGVASSKVINVPSNSEESGNKSATEDGGNMANQQQLMQSEDAVDHDASPPECLWSKNLKDLSNFQAVFGEIQRGLDPESEADITGDYRFLADIFGMKQSDIRHLEKRVRKPTKEVLDQFNPKLEELRGHLSSEKMGRKDIAKLIEDWVKENCECENCRPRSNLVVDLR